MGALWNRRIQRDPLDYSHDDAASPSMNRDHRVGGIDRRPSLEQTLVNSVDNAHGGRYYIGVLG